MPGPNSRPDSLPDTAFEAGRDAKAPSGRALLAVGAVAVVLLGGTVALWAHVGTAVFFETIRAGIMACFG